MNHENQLELAQVINALRQELITAQAEGTDVGIIFNIKNVEVELETIVGTEEVVGGGIKTKFFVMDMNANANVKFTNASKQKIKFNLETFEIVKNQDGTKTFSTVNIKDKA